MTIQAGSFSSVFDNQGNVSVPRLFTAGNIQTAGYLFGNGAFLTGIVAGSSYSNVQVATYLPTYTGVITASNVAVNGNVTAQFLFGNGSQLTGLPSSYSNVNVATYLPTYSGNVANIRLGVSGVLTFADGTTQVTAGGGSYSNVQVATYLPTYTGSLNASNILVTSANITIANIQATTAATNPATGALRVMGGVGVAGAVVAGQLNTTGNLIANAVSAYSLNTVANVTASVVNAGTINSSGNVLAQNLIGTIATASQTGITAVGTLATLSVTGNATVGNLVGSEANTRIIANTYITTFDIYGNVTFPGNVIAPYFVGDGSRLTGIVSGGGSSYGNSNVAQYLPTYSGNIANIRLGSSGVLTFADGTTQITAGGGSYSNVQVATYLPTYSGNIGNVSTTSNIVTSNQIISTRSGSAIRAENGSIFAGQNGTFVNAVLTNALNPYTGSNISLSSIYNFSDVNNIWSLGNIVTNGNVSAGNLSATGNITATGYIVTTGGFGNITQVDYITANNVVATANVTVQGIGVTMPNRPAFRVNGTALYGGAQSTANVNLRGVAVSTVYNQGSYFNATTGLFTAPIAGIYEVLLNARVNSSFNSLAQLVVLKNGLNTSGNIVAFWETTSNIGGATHFGVSGTVVLATGDYLSANILAGNVTFDANDNWSVTYLG